SEEVDAAMTHACARTGAEIFEFHVAPKIQVENELPYHEWFVEFAKEPSDIQKFRDELDAEMRRRNIYYEDLIAGNILQKAVIRALPRNSFIEYMKSKGKLGGQNKVPRLM